MANKQPLPKFRQTPGLCGPASLKIVLMHYNHRDLTEGELAALCRATPETGTDHADLVRAAETLGLRVEAKEQATLPELKAYLDRDIPVIVGFWDTYLEEGDHFTVVYDYDDTSLYMMDPQMDEGVRRMSVEEFVSLWYDTDGPDARRVERWMMAVFPGPQAS